MSRCWGSFKYSEIFPSKVIKVDHFDIYRWKRSLRFLIDRNEIKQMTQKQHGERNAQKQQFDLHPQRQAVYMVK